MPMPTRNILIVSNADDLRSDSMVSTLSDAGYQVAYAVDAPEARSHIEQRGLPHLIIIDLRLPDMQGLRLSQELSDLAGLPIITVSANDDATDVALQALEWADDYIRRSHFSPQETALRIRRILSRIHDFSYASGPEIQVYDWLSVNLMAGYVTVRGETRKLTPTENAILSVLLSHRGKVVDTDMLLDRVWREGEIHRGDRNALRVHVHRLRQKIEDDPDDPQVVRTVRGIGYSLASA